MRLRFLFSLCFWLALVGVGSPGWAHAEADDESTSVAPVIIEAPAPEPTLRPPSLSAPVDVPAGFGMKAIDAPRNELGVEIGSMERLDDFTAERRESPWFLSPELAPDLGRGAWLAQAHGEVGPESQLKARVLTQSAAGTIITAEAGGRLDHRDVAYTDPNGTIYNSADDTVRSYQKRDDSGYARIDARGRGWETLGDADARFRDTRAGSLLTGRQTQRQATLTGDIESARARLLPFAQFRADQFDSALDPLLSTRTTSGRGGLQTEIPLGQWSLNPTASYEELGRQWQDGTNASFSRADARLQLNSALYGWRDVELTGHLRGEAARDSSSTIGVWDAGVDLSSSHRFEEGARLRVRRFALVPTPSQRFGDGGLLQGTPDLPPEAGVRVATGPWWQRGDSEATLDFFFEESHDSPITVAVSPQNARTLPLGGVWNRGAELTGKTRLGKLAFSQDLVWQQATNASDVSWQKGQAIPGRPDWVSRTEARYEARAVQVGSRFEYRSREAMDLNGLFTQPPQQHLDAYVAYVAKSWEARLEADNLIYSVPPPGSFEGTAGPNVLEPVLTERELELQWEIVL